MMTPGTPFGSPPAGRRHLGRAAFPGTSPASRRAILLALAAGSFAGPLLACGRSTEPPLLRAEGVERVQPGTEAPADLAIAGMTDFGHRLCLASIATGRNWVASPLSIAVAFAMARVGAGGESAAQLDRVFAFPRSRRDEAFNAITRDLVTADVPAKRGRKQRDPDDPPAPPVVSIGNALFVQKDLPVGAAFLRTLAAQYGAGARQVDFGGTADALGQIDAWADKQTAGRIKKVFDTLPTDTRVVLANSAYFRADWKHPFSAISDGTFTRADGSTVRAPIMRDTMSIRYAEFAAGTAIELPYAAGPYAMWLMLPRPGGPPQALLARAALASVRTGLATASVDVAVPKWEHETKLDLVPVLKGLGLDEPFSPRADFGGISPGLSIGQALHAANITVDEWGTEAVAITALSMPVSAPMRPKIEFHADRPFAYAIVGGKAQTPVFIGCVNDPVAA